mmetsp:Transcript_10663/g.13177  ORF Transcript_10663/g.13177 Transcript_10663/m.13177 type:complete len:200 (-) Transcript_10663:90-689(-)|eukprot:CAMPEP_0172503884 /NCGR_PEP_ID=MMETSP1066-20121228/173349_1 /TAXON_ID=671091 /ORGANISM="Coscinodiscus wailesii, Strain CCMP2513" /LENGTH=199 /DNA_ID=CAMNT_0013279811 /DNA_START=187 /DNA_END=786 /DNA_ORIENTATION=-
MTQRNLITAMVVLVTFNTVTSFTPMTTFSRSSSLLSMTSPAPLEPSSRNNFLKQVAGVIAGGALLPNLAVAESLPSGVNYVIKKSGSGPVPTVGELVAIRFKATVGANVIDDIFDTPEPYYTRLGSGGLLKGVEEVLPLMRVGDRWELTIPGKMAFGPKGRPASAGKPRIPGDATVIFEVEMVGLPGKEQELIDIIGDD